MLYPHRFVGVFAGVEGSIIAVAGTTEKGKLDTKVTVMTPGGHSSIPPVHTVSMSSSPTIFI
jgi:acetylornithine deacetylase/succinyl-diaminopimelate desuccinylase-like protein